MTPGHDPEHALLALVVLAWTTLLSAGLVPLSRRLALRYGVMDVPGGRKDHAEPMPRLGGLAVFAAFTLTVLGGYLAIPLVRSIGVPGLEATLTTLGGASRVIDQLAALLVGGAVVFGVGLADDVLGRRFPPWAKLLGQAAAAVVIVGAGVGTTFLPGEGLDLVVSTLWVVGISNAFNLLDNMDGLSAGVGAIASGVLFLNAWSRGELFIALILVAFAGSLLGFLRFNFHPARVFLGDCGSLFIGYVMASLTLLERYVSSASSSLFPVVMPVLVLAVPLVDTTTVVFIRLREGRPVYVGDRRHLSHQLTGLGLSTRAAVLTIYLMTFCVGLGAALLPDATRAQTVLVLLQALGFVVLVLVLMFYRRNGGAEASS